MKRWIPSREQMRRSRWLAPVARHLEDDRLWHLERGSVARAVAIGLFFGLMLPFAQFLCAVATAVWLRGHVAIAAACTLVTNPLTFGPVYWCAHKIGLLLLGHAADDRVVDVATAHTEAVAASQGWLTALWQSVQSVGAPLVIGLAVLAVTASLVGYLAVWMLWRPRPPGAR